MRIMSVGRVGMFNFFTEADCEKFIAMHTTKVPELLERGLLEITWVRASPESVLMFVIFETKKKVTCFSKKCQNGGNNTILKSQIPSYLTVMLFNN